MRLRATPNAISLGIMGPKKSADGGSKLVDRIADVALVACAATLLTFARGAMLLVVGTYTIIDQVFAFAVLGLAPVCFFWSLRALPGRLYLTAMLPIWALGFWITLCLIYNTNPTYFPERSPIVTTILAVMVASRVRSDQLRMLRYMILGIAALFNLAILAFAPGVLGIALARDVRRFGAEFTPAAVITMPRIYYTLVLVCLASALVEKRWLLKLGALALCAAPLILGFAAGSRGPLLGFAVGVAVLVAMLRKSIGPLKSLGSLFVIGVVAVWTIDTQFSALIDRLLVDDTRRGILYSSLWGEAVDQLSVFGHGRSEDYPHNIFLELVHEYGLVGLGLFTIFLTMLLLRLWVVLRRWRSPEMAWVVAIAALEFVAQQLSLDIFCPQFWTAMLLVFGVCLCDFHRKDRSAPLPARRENRMG